MDAATRWKHDLEGRTVPDAILEAAPESPWNCPVELFRSRAARADTDDPTPTTVRALEALPPGGTILDVGCGGGATSLPLASVASLLVGVDGSAEMLVAYREAVERRDREVTTIHGRWPDVATSAPGADVAVSGHVLYNVQDLAPFVRALDAHAERRVVLELTEHHPLRWMNELWLRFHGLVFPDGPDAAVAERAIHDLGFDAARDDREADRTRGHGGFERREDAVAMIRRRLCLAAERDGEIADALGDRLRGTTRGSGPPARGARAWSRSGGTWPAEPQHPVHAASTRVTDPYRPRSPSGRSTRTVALPSPPSRRTTGRIARSVATNPPRSCDPAGADATSSNVNLRTPPRRLASTSTVTNGLHLCRVELAPAGLQEDLPPAGEAIVTGEPQRERTAPVADARPTHVQLVLGIDAQGDLENPPARARRSDLRSASNRTRSDGRRSPRPPAGRGRSARPRRHPPRRRPRARRPTSPS